MPITNHVQLSLPASRVQWTDTGVDVKPDDTLRVRTSGAVAFILPDSLLGELAAYPEGTYLESSGSHALDLGNVSDYTDVGGTNGFPSTNTRPYAVIGVLMPSGSVPLSTADAFVVNRDTTFVDPSPTATKRLWIIFNARNYGWRNGSFAVTIDVSNADPLPPNQGEQGETLPVGGRDVPDALWNHLQGDEQSHTWCFIVQPTQGATEGYTALDADVEFPGYTSPNGENELPAITCVAAQGVDLSAIPFSLQLEVDGSDATMFKFSAKRLYENYYLNAQVDVFVMNWKEPNEEPVCITSGYLGNAQVTDLTVTFEVIPWEDLTNKPLGDTMTYECRHRFGREGCRNEEGLNDGPLLADWTFSGTVVRAEVTSMIGIRLDDSENPPAGFYDHLADGKLSFTSGPCDGIVRDVKDGEVTVEYLPLGPVYVNILLRQSLPKLPELGDAIAISSGCNKLFHEGCAYYDNHENYGGFPWLPNREGVIRRA